MMMMMMMMMMTMTVQLFQLIDRNLRHKLCHAQNI